MSEFKNTTILYQIYDRAEEHGIIEVKLTRFAQSKLKLVFRLANGKAYFHESDDVADLIDAMDYVIDPEKWDKEEAQFLEDEKCRYEEDLDAEEIILPVQENIMNAVFPGIFPSFCGDNGEDLL